MAEYFFIFLKLGGFEFFIFFLLPVLVIIIWKIAASYFSKNKEKFPETASAAKRFLAVLFIFFIAFGVMLFLQTKINNQPAEKIINASNWCSGMDKHIFGVNVPFWLQDKNNSLKPFIDSVSLVSVYSYAAMILIFSLALLVSLVVDFSIFIRFIFAFTLIVFISAPIWYLIPAYTPMDMYYDNILKDDPSLEIRNNLNDYQPNEYLLGFFQKIKVIQGESSAGVSTFPSMHVGWSVVIAYFCFEIWPPLLILLIPYLLINSFSAILTLQHYAVDIPAGIFVAIIAIVLVNLIKISSNKVEITHLIQEDLSVFKR